MRRTVLVCVLLVLVGSASHFPFAYAQDGVCDGSELPCDPDRPWMRGTVEKACSHTGEKWQGDETADWSACDCKHTCAKDDPSTEETQGRRWDASCATRCSPRHCHCRNPCET